MRVSTYGIGRGSGSGIGNKNFFFPFKRMAAKPSFLMAWSFLLGILASLWGAKRATAKTMAAMATKTKCNFIFLAKRK